MEYLKSLKTVRSFKTWCDFIYLFIYSFFIQEQPAYVGIYTYKLHLEPEITFEIRLPINMLLLYHILFDWSWEKNIVLLSW